MSHYPTETLNVYQSDSAVQPTARGLLKAIVRDLSALFCSREYKTPYLLTADELEAARPEGDEAEWSAKDKLFWTGMQEDWNRHRMAPIKVYEQDLPFHLRVSPAKPEDPEDESGEEPPPPPFDLDESEALLPYIIVKLDSGSIDAPEGPETVKVILLVGIFDDDPANQGQLTVLEAVERIRTHYRERPALEAFMNVEPVNWYMQDEPSYPFYYGALDLTFRIPAPATTQGEEFC